MDISKSNRTFKKNQHEEIDSRTLKGDTMQLKIIFHYNKFEKLECDVIVYLKNMNQIKNELSTIPRNSRKIHKESFNLKKMEKNIFVKETPREKIFFLAVVQDNDLISIKKFQNALRDLLNTFQRQNVKIAQLHLIENEMGKTDLNAFSRILFNTLRNIQIDRRLQLDIIVAGKKLELALREVFKFEILQF